ncbi:MAG: hypothetical protein EAZ29_04210, partial [Runella slithyformis]
MRFCVWLLVFLGQITITHLQLKDHLTQIFRSLPHFMPETAWIMAFVLVAMLELLLRRSRWKAQIPAILGATLFGMALVVLVFVVQQWNDGTGHLFHRLLFLDKQAVFFKIAITVATL